MERTISFDTSNGILEIKHDNKGDWYELDEISLPKDSITDCSGIWKDESLFEMEGDWNLRIPTNVLLGLIEATRKLVNDKDTSWWSREPELHKKFKNLLK